MPPNTACTRPPANYAGVVMVGLLLRSVRVFRQFVWLEVGSVKVALSRPAHQRVTHTVGRQVNILDRNEQLVGWKLKHDNSRPSTKVCRK